MALATKISFYADPEVAQIINERVDRAKAGGQGRGAISEFINEAVRSQQQALRVEIPSFDRSSIRTLLPLAMRAQAEITFVESSLSDIADDVKWREMLHDKVKQGCRLHFCVIHPDIRDPEHPGRHLYDVLEHQLGKLRADDLIDEARGAVDFFRELKKGEPSSESLVRIFGCREIPISGITIIDPRGRNAAARMDLLTSPSREVLTPYINLDLRTGWGAYAISALDSYCRELQSRSEEID